MGKIQWFAEQGAGETMLGSALKQILRGTLRSTASRAGLFFRSVLPMVSLCGLLALGYAAHAAEDMDEQQRKFYSRIEKWELSFSWEVGDSIQLGPREVWEPSTKAEVNFSGHMKTVLKRKPGRLEWTNEEDGAPIWSVSYKGIETLTPHPSTKLKEIERIWSNGPVDPENDRPSAALSIDVEKNTYDLNGCVNYLRIRTKNGKQEDKTRTSMPIRSPDSRYRKEFYLESGGQELISGTYTFPIRLEPFALFNPDDFKNKKIPDGPGSLPWTRVRTQWVLRAVPSEYRFEYGSTDKDICRLHYARYMPIHPNVAHDGSGNWFLHSNFEGQVFIDNKPQLRIQGKKVTGLYGIRRISRTWFIDTDGRATCPGLGPEPLPPEGNILTSGWIFDSMDQVGDWQDLAAFPVFSESHWGTYKAVLDEFLVGVVETDSAAYHAWASRAKKMFAGQLPEKDYFEELAGMPVFGYIYAAYIIERAALPEGRRVFRITYAKPEALADLQSYRKYYKNLKPNFDYPWGRQGGGWKEIKEVKGKFQVVDLLSYPE